jgi:hypothetical protein
MERFDVVELAADPPGWNSELDSWRESYGDVVVDFPTNERKRMSAACDRFRIGVLEGDLSHDGNAVLSRHLGACENEVDAVRRDHHERRQGFPEEDRRGGRGDHRPRPGDVARGEHAGARADDRLDVTSEPNR